MNGHLDFLFWEEVMNSKYQYSSVLFGIAILIASCAPQQAPAPPDMRAADEKAIRDADMAWSNAAATGLDGFLSYYTDDAALMAPNEPIAVGKEAARKALEPLFALPGFSVKWQTAKVDVSGSGDIGYARGTYELTMNDPAGKPMTDRGKYLEVWRKQADGTWKCTVDMFNSDIPAAPPPAK